MRSAAAVLLGTLALGGVAHAQSSTAAAEERGYVEAVGHSSFGNVTSQSFGAEAGFTVLPRVQVIVEAGRTNDVSPASLGAAAQLIAGSLSQTVSNAAFTVKEPAAFFDAGVRFMLLGAGDGRVRPYVMAAVGVARLQKNVRFTVGGTDVTDALPQAPYYVTLGTDLSGSASSAMIVGGGGVVVPLWKQLVFDVQVRIGRILADEEAITVGRVGGGIGVRF
jgi:hypothetical protein